jgi:hypothetical protein
VCHKQKGLSCVISCQFCSWPFGCDPSTSLSGTCDCTPVRLQHPCSTPAAIPVMLPAGIQDTVSTALSQCQQHRLWPPGARPCAGMCILRWLCVCCGAPAGWHMDQQQSKHPKSDQRNDTGPSATSSVVGRKGGTALQVPRPSSCTGPPQRTVGPLLPAQPSAGLAVDGVDQHRSCSC